MSFVLNVKEFQESALSIGRLSCRIFHLEYSTYHWRKKNILTRYIGIGYIRNVSVRTIRETHVEIFYMRPQSISKRKIPGGFWIYKNITHIFNNGYIETICLNVLLWYRWCYKVKRLSMDIDIYIYIYCYEFANIVCKICIHYLFLNYNISDALQIFIFGEKYFRWF